MRKLYFVVIFMMTFVGTLNNVSAQVQYDNVRFKQLFDKRGELHNSISDITQDNRGFIYIATRNGFFRYDGNEIKTFKYRDDDATSLSHNIIYDIINDPSGRYLWLNTEGGVCRYDTEKEIFKRYDADVHSNKKSLFLYTAKSNVLVGASDGIYRYDPDADCFVEYIIDSSKAYPYQAIVQAYESVIWIRKGREILCYDQELQRFVNLPNTILTHIDSVLNLVSVLPDRVLIETLDGELYIYNFISDEIARVDLSMKNNVVKCTTIDALGNLWIGAENGIFIVNQKLEQIAHFYQDNSNLSRLNDTPIYKLFTDRDNNIWVGTYFGGVNYCVYGNDQFRTYPFGYSNNHLSGKAIRQMAEDKSGNIYIATEDGGVDMLDSDRKVTRSQNMGLNIKGRNIHSLLFDQSDNLYIGHYIYGVQHHDFRSGRTADFHSDTQDIASHIYKHNEEELWYFGSEGIYVADEDSREVTKLFNVSVSAITPFSDRELLLGTRRTGVCRLDLVSRQITPLSLSVGDGAYISYIFCDSNNELWVGSNNDGIYRYDSQWREIRHYTERDLGSNSIKCIVEDNNGLIWVSTDNGLCSLNLSGDKVMRYTESDGLPTNRFNYNSVLKTETGELFFGTIDGLVSFYPDKLRRVEASQDIVLTEIWSGDELMTPSNEEAMLPISVSLLDDLTVEYENARTLGFRFSLLNYKYNNNVDFMLMMEGVDDEWQHIHGSNYVRYSNLRHGRYTLKIKLSDNDDGQMLSLPIRILPPWWLSVVAIIIYVVALIIILYIVYRYTKLQISLRMQLYNEQSQRESVEKLTQQKIDFFTYVSHDLRTPLTLILSPINRMIEQQQFDGEAFGLIQRNANRMQYLINELLTFSKIEMNQSKIVVRNGDIIRFVEELGKTFNVVAQDRQIELNITLESQGQLVWFSPSKLERILYNLLSNAMKYTDEGGRVDLAASISREADQAFVTISVSDNGRGIAVDEIEKIFDSYYQSERRDNGAGFGLGLALTKSLVNLHRGVIDVTSRVGEGSTFTVKLNVSEGAYSGDERSKESITLESFKKYNLKMYDTIDLLSNRVPYQEHLEDRKCVLIVEDNVEMNQYIRGIFSKSYNVMTAFDGKEAIRVLNKVNVDIIISDVMMPNMDGYELTSFVKNNIAFCHIPVILLTAKSEDKDVTGGYECGANAYIPKPFSAKNTELLVKNTLTQIRQNIERFKNSEQINPSQVTTSHRDEAFLRQLIDIIKANMSNESFNVDDILLKLGVSRSLLHNKIKSLTGYSIVLFIRFIKMKEAKRLLGEGLNISETSFAVGISDPNYFARVFKKEFDISPSEYQRGLNIQK